MMKRRVTVLLVIVLCLQMFTACGNGLGTAPVRFYYVSRNAESLESQEVILPEDRNVRADSLTELLRQYLIGPETETLVSPFPAGTEVLEIVETEDAVSLCLSVQYFSLTGIDLSVANCCMCQTVCAYTGKDRLILMDETQTIQLNLNPEQYLLGDQAVEESSKTFTLYFPDINSRYLLAETKNATLSHNETEAAFVMRKLQEGPDNNQMQSLLPDETRIRSVTVADGMCTVDFTRAFLDNRPDDVMTDFLILYGITDSLTDLEEIDAVQFFVEGDQVSSYGVFDLSHPLQRYSACIGPVRTANGEVDVNLFALKDDDQIPLILPARVKQTISQPLAEAVVLESLRMEPPSGFYNPIPFGTELLSISVSANVCYLDVSERLIPQEDTELAEYSAVWALVSPLLELDGIRAVSLTVNGENNGLKYVNLQEPLNAAWIANTENVYFKPAA